MRIAIVSDSHDNIPNIDKMLAFCKKEKIETMIHCGDVCAPDTLKYLADNFTGEIWWTSGNVHGELDLMIDFQKKLSKLHYVKDGSLISIPNVVLKIGITHYPDVAKKLAADNDLDFVFHGHTHQPWEAIVGNCKVVNPGTLAGMFNKATFAVLNTETKNLELKLLELL